MPIPTVRPPRIRDYEDQYQREARDAIRDLDQPGARRLTVGPQALSGTTTLVRHGLGRIPTGWLIIDKTAQADVWRDTTQTMTKDVIPLKASGAVTVTLQFW